MVNINISQYSPAELKALQKRIKKEQDTRTSKMRRTLRAKFKKEAAFEGMTLRDVFPELRGKAAATSSKPGPKKRKTKAQILYRNRATGETWTGYGRPPQWISNLMRQRNIDIKVFKNLPEYKA